MGHSLAVTPTGGTGDRSPDVAEVLDEESGVQPLLEALGDRDCRCILDATGDDALSANEVADACNLPLSTTYRKLALLTDTALLDERTRIRRSGKHASEYACAVETVVVSFDDGAVELAVSRGTETPSQAHFSPG